MDNPLEGLALQRGDRVLVLGGYGTRNVGDEAILSGLLSQLPRGIDVRVVSRNPAETMALHGVRAVSPGGAPAALLHSNVLIVGGGGIFSGHMGPFGKLMPFFALLAKARGARVAFHGVGVYPSAPLLVRRSLRWVAPRLASFSVRDDISLRTLESWGIGARRVPDLSSSMAPAPRDRGASLLLSMRLEAHKPKVALCLTATEPRIEGALLEAVPRLVRTVGEAEFCLIPMSQHPTVPRHNDMALAQKLMARAPGLHVLEGWHHPADILSLFGLMDAAVCMRYHSLLFAERAGVAVVVVPYAEKCESWLEESGMRPTPPTAAELAQAVRRALSHPAPRTWTGVAANAV